MASPAERTRNNVRAGVFVSVAIILAIVTMVIVSGVWDVVFRSVERYTVRYSVAAGVSNVKRGSEVKVGGVAMGRVTGVSPVPGEPFEYIDVDFKLDSAVRLFADARVYVSAPLLGSDAWLDISSVGDPESGAPPDGQIEGVQTTGMLDALLGPENAADASAVVRNTREFSEFLADVPDEYDRRVVPILDDAKATSTEVRELATRINDEDWPRWARSVDEVMTWTTDFTDDLNAAVAEGHDLLRDARATVSDNRPQIDRIVDNVDDATDRARSVVERVQTETVDKVHGVLDRGQEAVDSAVGTLEQLRVDYELWASDLGETLANASLASQQLKLATIEVRRSPWKLLYRPSDKELEHELLYDAARSFAMASADLKAAAASVRGILAENEQLLAEDPELFDRVKRNLLDPLRNYEMAQQRLLDVLLTQPAP